MTRDEYIAALTPIIGDRSDETFGTFYNFNAVQESANIAYIKQEYLNTFLMTSPIQVGSIIQIIGDINKKSEEYNSLYIVTSFVVDYRGAIYARLSPYRDTLQTIPIQYKMSSVYHVNSTLPEYIIKLC
jgi:hypothetical protein